MAFAIAVIYLWIHLSVLVLVDSQSGNGTIYARLLIKGATMTDIQMIDLTECTPAIPWPENNRVSINSINPVIGCANIYKEVSCKGDYVTLNAGMFETIVKYWRDWTFHVGSFGPCDQECVGMTMETRPATATSLVTFQGNETRTYDVKGCVSFSTYGGMVELGRIYFNDSICVELYKQRDCTGPSVRLQKGIASRSAIKSWESNAGRSISICGYNCAHPKNENTEHRKLPSPGPDYVSLYSYEGYSFQNAENKTVPDVSKCTSSPRYDAEPATIPNTIAYNDCLNLYKDVGCVGRYISKLPGQNYVTASWTEDGNDILLGSIGPCDDCAASNVPSERSNSSTLTLYDAANRQGKHGQVNVTGCSRIPKNLKKHVESIHPDDLCIELHEYGDCTGRSVQLGKGSRQLNVLASTYATLSPTVINLSNDSVGYVSLCGYNCNRTVLERKLKSPSPDVVTLFDQDTFNGNFYHLNISQGCVEFKDELFEWNSQILSIHTYKQCIIIYSLFGCSSSRYGQHLILNERNTADHANIDLKVQAIKPCYQEASSTYAEIDFMDSTSKEELDVSTCQSSPRVRNQSIEFQKAFAYNDCLNVYEGPNCSGKYISKIPSGPTSRENYTFSWNDGDASQSYNPIIGSLGPCDDQCQSKNSLVQTSRSVKLFDSQDYKGTNVTIDVNGCHIIPRKLRRRVESIKYINEACIELHEHWDCTGRSVERGSGSRQLNILVDKEVGVKYAAPATGILDWRDPVKSVSPCGYNCKRPCTPPKIISSPGLDFVTVFDEPDYNGNFQHLNLKSGCINITEEWEGESRSIMTYSKCTTLYSLFGCSITGESAQLNESTQNFQVNLPFNWKIRSIKFCDVSPEVIYLDTALHTALIVSGLILLGVVLVASFIIVRLRRRDITKLTAKEIQEFLDGIQSASTTSPRAEANDYVARAYDQKFEVPKNLLVIDMKCLLGSGEFGVVYKGQVKEPGDSNKFLEVAVKALKPNAKVEYTRELLKEIKTMIYVGNQQRIVQLVGCCTENLANNELYVMIELCSNGCMAKFLRKNKEAFVNLVENGQIVSNKLTADEQRRMDRISPSYFNTINLMQWSWQIAEGMEYLAYKKVVHADLATRNVLLAANFNAKISDFGLSRQLYQYSQYKKQTKTPLPWRWLAIESLKSLSFSSESDVWAFGVTLWEMFSLGDVPFPEKSWSLDFVRSLEDGYRLSKPKNTPSEWWYLILECWNERPADRITFRDLRAKFLKILLQLLPENAKCFENSNMDEWRKNPLYQNVSKK